MKIRLYIGVSCLAVFFALASETCEAQNKNQPKNAPKAPPLTGIWEGNVNSTVSVRLVLDADGGGELAWLAPATRSTIISAAVTSVQKKAKEYQITTKQTAVGSSSATVRNYTMDVSADGKKVKLKSAEDTYELFKVEKEK